VVIIHEREREIGIVKWVNETGKPGEKKKKTTRIASSEKINLADFMSSVTLYRLGESCSIIH
jgi:hypothetical protein